jgi:DNA-binding MarR family transcriptional regulator
MRANARVFTEASMSADASGSDQASTLRDSLRRLIVTHAALDGARRPCGTPLPVPHAWALLELRQHGAMTVSTLAERLNIDRTNVSRLCARMESLGEIARVVHPDDGRAWLVELSAKGSRLARSVDMASSDHFGQVLERLPEASPDAFAVIAALDALTAAMLARRADLENPR